jgi:hypothetical protein
VTNVDGFDRTVSFDAGATCANIAVSRIISLGTAEGSAVGINEPQAGEITENMSVSDVVATDVSNSAIVVGTGARNVSISNVVATRCGNGIVTIDGVAQGIRASGLKGRDNGRGCSVTADADQISFSDIIITDQAGNTANGLFVRADSPRGIVFSDAQIESNSYHAVNIRASGVELQDITTTGSQNLGMTLAGNDIAVSGYSDRDPDGNGRLRIESTASDCRITTNTDVSILDKGTRTRINGQVEVSGPPKAGDYGPSDAGIRIIDTSTSPVNVYYVLRDGELVRTDSE